VGPVASRGVPDERSDEPTREEPGGDGDDLPEELDVTAFVGPYVFPDIRRRRIAAALYVVVGACALAIGVTPFKNSNAPVP